MHAQKHDLEKKIAEVVAATLKERPTDPLTYIGEYLIKEAKMSTEAPNPKFVELMPAYEAKMKVCHRTHAPTPGGLARRTVAVPSRRVSSPRILAGGRAQRRGHQGL